MKSSINDEHNVEVESWKRAERGIQGMVVKLHNQALLSGLSYCFSFCGMILINKFVLSTYDFVPVVIVSVLSLLGLVSTEPLTWRLIKVWLPVNVIFVGMLITSMFKYAVFNLVFWQAYFLLGPKFWRDLNPEEQ